MESFSFLMKKARKQAHLTQNQLAEALNVSGAYIAKLEKGGHCPSAEFIGKLCAELNLSLSDMFLAAQLESGYPEAIRDILNNLRKKNRLLEDDTALGAVLKELEKMSETRRKRYFEFFIQMLNLCKEDKALD